MLVEGQGIGHPALTHHDKRNAVHKAPGFVFVLFEEVESGFKDFWIESDDFHIGGVLKLVDDVDDFRPKPLS